jgi:phosphinothricin acetyltransferase
MNTTLTPCIRLAREADLPAINSIYNHYVAHCTCTYQITPETSEARLAWFRKHDPHHPVTVSELDGEVVGWASLNAFHPREAYARTVENSLYIRHDRQRRGIGSSLLADLIVRSRFLRHHTILALISADQPGSIALHEAYRFVKVGHMRQVGWKFDRWLDVVTYQLLL